MVAPHSYRVQAAALCLGNSDNDHLRFKMKTPTEIKVVPIGNSRGVHLPKATLTKYSIKSSVHLEEREEGILLRSKNDKRLSWEDTFNEMAREKEDWSDLDAAAADGLDRDSW
jgi:antitoxin MazE